MSLWYESFMENLQDCEMRHNTPAAKQKDSAACILRYLAMPVPKGIWEDSLKKRLHLDFAQILHECFLELQSLPELKDKIDHASLVAISFINDTLWKVTDREHWTPEKYMAEAEKILAGRSDLRLLGEEIRKSTQS